MVIRKEVKRRVAKKRAKVKRAVRNKVEAVKTNQKIRLVHIKGLNFNFISNALPFAIWYLFVLQENGKEAKTKKKKKAKKEKSENGDKVGFATLLFKLNSQKQALIIFIALFLRSVVSCNKVDCIM